MPGVDSLVNGDIGRKRSMLAAMIHGCWAACHAPCPDTGHMFMADAIISNPPTFAHIHCAEALGIPLHMTFSKPYFFTPKHLVLSGSLYSNALVRLTRETQCSFHSDHVTGVQQQPSPIHSSML